MVARSVCSLVPTRLPPRYVLVVSVTSTVFPPVFWLAHAMGGVHSAEAAAPVHTVTWAVPHLAVMLWVKSDEAAAIRRVPFCPSTSSPETEEALGISGRLILCETVRAAGVHWLVKPLCHSADRVTLALPAASWATVTVLVPSLYHAFAP